MNLFWLRKLINKKQLPTFVCNLGRHVARGKASPCELVYIAKISVWPPEWYLNN